MLALLRPTQNAKALSVGVCLSVSISEPRTWRIRTSLFTRFSFPPFQLLPLLSVHLSPAQLFFRPHSSSFYPISLGSLLFISAFPLILCLRSAPPFPSSLAAPPLPLGPAQRLGPAPSASLPLAPPLHYTLPSRSRPSCLTPPLPLSLPSGPAPLLPPFWAATPPPFLAPSVPPSLLAAPPPFLAPHLLS